MESILKRLWRSSPASLAHAARRRLQFRDRQPGWYTIRSGPAAGAQLLLPHAREGGWREMMEGTFDLFLYTALKTQRDLKGAVCWDVGAHVGYHSLGFAAQGAEVLAFEPNRANAERLLAHLEKNPTLGAHIRHTPVALSDRDGKMTFVQCTDLNTGSSGSHLAEALPPLGRGLYTSFEQLEVPAMRIDTLIERGERPPEVLKIDVEGGEYLVLQGGRKLLQEKKPILLMEVHHICLMLEVQRFLQTIGYSTRVLDEEHAAPSRCFVMATPA
jgi:FkbM family methyltransferase